jgi:hypothetical protein
MFDAPRNKLLMAMRWVSLLNGTIPVGGPRSWKVAKAVTRLGRALLMIELDTLVTNARIIIFREFEKLRGSAGSGDGLYRFWSGRAFWNYCDEYNILGIQVDVIFFDFVMACGCSYEFSVYCRWSEMLLLMACSLVRHAPINVTVPGGAISLSSCLSREKACLN